MLHTHKHAPLTTAIMLATTTTAAIAESPNKTFALDKVTVAATLTEQKQQDVANTVSVITEENIENNLSSNIRDMLRYEPGVEVGGSTGDAERFGIKGFNIRGIDENRVKITVDGIDQPRSFTPDGNPFQRAGRNYVDIDSIKRVEIVKGPASTLYGSEALGGVVAFTTKDPADYLKPGDNSAGRLKLRYGSADKSTSQTLTLANRNGNLESLLVYTHRDTQETDNHSDFSNAKDDMDYNSDNILAKLQYQINDAHRIGLTAESFKSENNTDLSRKLGEIPYGPTYSIIYADFYFGDDTTERQRLSIFHDWTANNAAFDQLHWQIDWQDSEIDQETHTMYGNTYATPVLRIKDYSEQEEQWRLSAQFDKTAGIHQLTYGLEYQLTDLQNQQNTLYPTVASQNTLDRAVPLVEEKSYGLFFQDQISLMDGKLLVTPGVRYDKFEAEPKDDSNFNPADALATAYSKHDSDKATFRLGTVYKFSETTSVFAQYSQGFKAPDLIDLYYGSERNYGPGAHFLTLPNPELEPEESDSYEIGLRLNGEAGDFELVGFYNDYNNFIEDATTSPNHNGSSFDRVTQASNIEEATIWGIEMRGALWLDQAIGAPQGTSLQASIAYANGENDTNDQPLESIAPLKAVVGISYDAPSDVWGATLNLTLVDAKDTSDLADETKFATPGYGTVDLTAYYHISKAVELRAGFFNLTDKKYWVYEDMRGKDADDDDLNRYTQPGRNFTASAIYKF